MTNSTLYAQKKTAENFEIVLRYNNSPDIWTLCCLKPFIEKDEGDLFLASFTDIGLLKKYEEELRIINEKLKSMNTFLQVKVNDETARRLKNEHILFEQKKFADMGQMINAIAHQWRQPLNSLGLMIQMFDDRLEKDEIRDMVSIIQHMSSTIDDFRCFFKSGNDSNSFNLIECLLESYSLYKSKIEYENVEFRMNCCCKDSNFELLSNKNPDCKTDFHINGSTSKLKQVFLNLFQNALDAINDSGRAGIISVAVQVETLHVAVSIEDNGGGVKPDYISKIFDPYFTTKEEGKGTGIGLYMTKTIIEEHFSGKISVMNTNTGAKFVIQLPLVITNVS